MLKPMTPRQSRVAQALLNAPGWIARETIDCIAGASDGLPTQPGRYRLTPEGRTKLAAKEMPHA